MRKPSSVKALEKLGRVRLSEHFFMRDMLYSEVSNFDKVPNIPEKPDLAIEAGTRLCKDLLEPLHATFGHVSIRSAYRSAEMNNYCNLQLRKRRTGYTCASTEANHARHVWDIPDPIHGMGATACIVIPWFIPRYEAGTSWTAMAWWIHDNLPYSYMTFYPIYAAFNLGWHECPIKRIYSHVPPKDYFSKHDLNHDEDHSLEYPEFPTLKRY